MQSCIQCHGLHDAPTLSYIYLLAYSTFTY
jgi:hypothetical protein